jgi:MscS family membrane protein
MNAPGTPNMEVSMREPSSSVRSAVARRAASTVRSVALFVALLSFGASGASAAAAQGRPTGADTANAPGLDADSVVQTSPGSPRAALEQFLSLSRAGRYADAAAYLTLADTASGARAAVARQIKAVLDRDLWIDLDRISASASGNIDDGLPASVEQVGTVRRPNGTSVPIRLVRTTGDADISWRFSRRSVTQLAALYASLDDRWILERVPDVLLRPGPFDLLRWQWLALPLLLAAAALVGALATRLLRAIVGRVVVRTGTTWDDAVVERLHAPAAAALTIAAVWVFLPALSLYAPAQDAAQRLTRVALFIVFFWALWRLVDVVRHVLAGTRWAVESPSSRSLLPLGARSVKIVVIALAAVAVLSMLGYPVGSLLAGLGIGGLALALAAQKTVENLFGAFSIGVDQPFREGDFVKVDDFVGTVEAIGLRSTRFRTLDRTIVTLPNGKVADMRLESFAVRDRLRLAAVIGLAYETTVAQMREVLAGFERVLRDQPKLWPDSFTVKFSALAASSLDVEVMAWFQTTDWGEFQLIRQEVLLRFMEVVERAGTSIAFPTRTVHLGGEAVDALQALASARSGDGATASSHRT